MNREKKKYLSLYALQSSKIIRLKNMPYSNSDKKAKILAEIKKCQQIQNKIETKIKNTDNGILSELLFLKYICGKSIMETAEILNYSIRQTERLHIKALEKFEL